MKITQSEDKAKFRKLFKGDHPIIGAKNRVRSPPFISARVSAIPVDEEG